MKPTPIRFLYGAAAAGDRPDVLAVDGAFGTGPNLSHWPGHRTPERYRHDLSTGSALLLAADPDRATFLRGVAFVANNHYDTDGLLSVFSVMQPAVALEHRDRLLAAARAGDFEEAADVDAVKRDALVTAWPVHPESPIAFAVRGLDRERAEEFAYRHLLARLPGVLLDLDAHEPLWRDAARRFERDIAAARTGAIRVERRPDADLAVVYADDGIEPGPYGLATLAAPSPRILLVRRTSEGPHYRFRQGARSWFDLPSTRPLRLDPRSIAADPALTAPSAEGAWLGDDPANVTAEMVFGRAVDRTGVMDSGYETTPCDLAPDVVVAAIERAARAAARAAPPVDRDAPPIGGD